MSSETSPEKSTALEEQVARELDDVAGGLGQSLGLDGGQRFSAQVVIRVVNAWKSGPRVSAVPGEAEGP